MRTSAQLYSFNRYEAIRRRVRAGFRLFGVAGALMLSGCQVLPEPQPDPTRFFVLNAPEPPAISQDPQEDGLVIGLHGIELSAYLRNTRSMLVARGQNELVYRDFDRWAEPLDAGLGRVVRETLLAHERITNVDAFPFTGDLARDFDITVRVLRCEGVETADGGRVARLIVAYEITEAGIAGGRVVEGRFAARERPWDGEAESLAAALGEAAAETARTIADALPRPGE